jgi:hypothetical protein
MKLVPGYSFKVVRKGHPDFTIGADYRIYHISPSGDNAVSYIFQSTSGNIKVEFDSTELAEKTINRMIGK